MKSDQRKLLQVRNMSVNGELFSRPLALLGQKVQYFLEYLGVLTKLSIEFWGRAFNRPVGLREILNQCQQIGLASMPIAGITLLFVGLVFAFQFGFTLSKMGAVPYVGKVSSLAIVRELGPVFTALVVGGRVGAGMAAEIGSMRVTEQIDAIRALGASPYKKLLVPRVIASTLMLPIVSLFAGFIGILGAMLISWAEFEVSPTAFYQSAIETVTLTDFFTGFLKPFVFGFFIAIIGCHHGFTCGSGTVGVGRATTLAVVNISLMVVFTDFILTRFFVLFQ